MKKIIILSAGIFLFFQGYHAQYNSCASVSEVTETRRVEVKDRETGKVKYEDQKVRVKKRDAFGNAAGNQYDLAVDGAFEGQTILVLQLVNINFDAPKNALAEKGFSVYRYVNKAPSPEELKKSLDKACQLWVISGSSQQLNNEHARVIQDFFNQGKGVYIWGDNTPYHADADFLTKQLLGTTMSGTYQGDQNVTFKDYDTKGGMLKNHLITTGLEYVYEGITISKIHDQNQQLTPLIWSSDGNVVAGIYERDGKRLIIDGGFTRLYYKWNTAGTGRYVKNAAAWLINYERFGDEVLGENLK
ncbi:MAG: hypothetical protein EP338_06995 [Bacteroidetes bacterium]|nr:MAG: hypothetical protein EP338_06995 [Bacteroidota bacterium]